MAGTLSSTAEANLTLAKRNFLPSVSADANWKYRGQELPYAPNWMVGATLTVPVLNSPLFSELSELNEVAANLASAQVKRGDHRTTYRAQRAAELREPSVGP
jgi:outer membrane protein TolC